MHPSIYDLTGTLDDQQFLILVYWAEELTKEQIGDKFGYKKDWVHKHLKIIYPKLGAHTRQSAVDTAWLKEIFTLKNRNAIRLYLLVKANMKPSTNFFKLNLTHQAVIDFFNDHQLAVKAHQQSYDYLKKFDTTGALIVSQKSNEFAEGIKFYRALCHYYFLLHETYTNMLISYYAFKKSATEDSEIDKEFCKLPPDISPIQQHFEELLEGYQTAMATIKKLI